MSGLYNAIMGYNPACIYFLPMLDRKPEDYPRFRDCFLSDDSKRIVIYTRVGGGNRGCGFGEDKLYKDPNYVTTYDDDFDNTYGSYEFNVPEKWQKDFDAILNGDFDKVSDEYKAQTKKIYPDIDVEKYFTLADGTGEVEHDS